MSSTVVLGLLGSLTIIVVLFEMLRRQTLREKYAVLWFLIAVACLLVAAFPALLFLAADVLGVQVPANLLFFVASLVLLGLTLQHSHELGRLEEKTRTLAEDLAIVKLELERERAAREDRAPATSPVSPDPDERGTR